MTLIIRNNEDLKNMVGYMIREVNISPPNGALVLSLTHITEPNVKYQVYIEPNIQFGFSGNVMVANRGLIIKSVGVVQAEPI